MFCGAEVLGACLIGSPMRMVNLGRALSAAMFTYEEEVKEASSSLTGRLVLASGGSLSAWPVHCVKMISIILHVMSTTLEP